MTQPSACASPRSVSPRTTERDSTTLPKEAEVAGVSYTFVGYLARKRNGKGTCVVDDSGNVLGAVVAGDSFVTLHADSN
jgi:hypothetical protein